MIQEETVTLRKQTPEAPNEWLYEVVEEKGEEKREFKPFVYLGSLICSAVRPFAYPTALD